jgi:hypothetical protein
MKRTGLEFILSTHEDGRPKGRFLIHTAIEYFIVSAVLFGLGLFLYYYIYIKADVDVGVFSFMPFMLITFSLLTLILGIRNLQSQETIKVDEYGVTITKGRKTKSATWSEIIEVKSWRTLYPTAGYKTVAFRPIEQVVVRTGEWKSKIKVGNFTKNELKELFQTIVERARESHFNIIDELDWLPNYMEFQKGKQAGQSVRLREYRILLKIGLGMLLIGVLMFPAVYHLDLFNSMWFAVLAIFLVFGAMLSLAGGLGIGEEKKKLQSE